MNKIIPFMLILFFISGSLVGTFSPVSASRSVENIWVPKTSMSQTRFGLGVVAVDGKIYAIGGFTQSGYLGFNEQYDPVTDVWTTLMPMPTPRNDFTIAAYDGKIYCIGGITPKEGGGWFKCAVNEVYDVAANSWSTKASLPVNGSDFKVHAADGKIFVLFARNLYMYDPNTDSWTEKASMPTTIVSRVSFVLTSDRDDKIVVIGEFQRIDSPNANNENVMIYDPKTDTWSGKTSPSAGKFSGVVGVTTGIYAPQRVYIFDRNITSVYDPVNDVWSTAKAIRTPRYAFGVAVVDDVLYAIGGAAPNTGVEFLSVNEQYIPIGYNDTLTPSTSPSAPPEHSNTASSNTISERSDFEFSLTYIAVTVLVLTVGLVTGGLFFYFRQTRMR